MVVSNGDSSRRGELSNAKRALLEKRLRGELQVTAEMRGIPQRPPEMPAYLSFAQQRLWFLYQLEPDSPVYNIPNAIRLQGPLDVLALERSLDEIVRRHEVLRTTFATVDGQPIQVIASELSLSLPVLDVQSLPDTEREAQAKRLIAEEAQRPFDLAQGPVLRAMLLRLGEQDHILLLNWHHIASDEWSYDVFWQEMKILYAAFVNGKPSTLPELPIQYADFAYWQRERLTGEILEPQLTYWKQQLYGNAPTLELPTDHPRPAIQTFRGTTDSFVLPKALTRSLKALSIQENVTHFVTLLSAFNVLLYRYTGQEDILVGTPITLRSRKETQALIGLFLNTLVMRTNLSGNPTFLELMRRVRDVAVGAYGHSDLPFERLVAELAPDRNLSQSPLFQVMFVLHYAGSETLTLPGLTQSTIDIHTDTAKFDLTLFMAEAGDELVGRVEYNTDLFEPSTITRMLGHFRVLLDGIAANPRQGICDLPLLTQAEQHLFLEGWNDTRANYADDLCVHELFQMQVQRTPEAVAIAFEELHMTYYELNRRANQLAHYLRGMGVGPDSPVAIFMERSLEMVIGVLGVLKAGGAYVPLDPTYPHERLAFMLTDTSAVIVLTQSHMVHNLAQHTGTVVCVDAEWDAIAQQSEDDPLSGVTVDNLAYVLFTSGSTGRPKGVAMDHRPLFNLVSWQLENTTLGIGAKTLQFASLSFDVSFQEIFTTLCSGGTLVLISDMLRRDAMALAGFLRDAAVERVFVPFIALQQLAEVVADDGPLPASLSEIITAGEQLQITPAVARLLEKMQGCTLHNQYGPTETHVVTAFTLTGDPNDWPLLPPIGRPIANTQIYLLDAHMQPVPIGVPGELYIGGECLARGYLNRPALTAARFVLNPLIDQPGARLYRTGDVARYQPDGNIEFLGRVDHQVKIRGHRVELGEIEAVLAQHPTAVETVVMAREDVPGHKRLVAYVVLDRKDEPTHGEMRRFLGEKLPDYMVPFTFVTLETFPLTASGKVNRRALPPPDLARPELETVFVAPHTPVEEVLAGMWARVLGIDRVGIHDDFFESGGHSLLATQLVNRIRKAFRVDLPLRALFEAPTVAALSQVLIANEAEPGQTEKAAQILKKVFRMSNDEIEKMLDEKRKGLPNE